jgi:hypothetical protein
MLEEVKDVPSGQPKRQLGISKDLEAKAGIPIPAPRKLDARHSMFPNGYEFPICKLVKVHFDPAKEIKRNDTVTPTPVVIFVFITKDGKQFTHLEFPVEDDDENFDKKHEQIQQRIKHIFDETVGASKFIEGSMNGGTYAEFFSNVAKSFNTDQTAVAVKESDTPKSIPTYSKTEVYWKITYYQTRLQVPLYPNFIQKAFNGKGEQIPCELQINPQYDKLVAQEKAKPAAPYAGGTNAEYGGGAAGGYDDYPDIP